MLHTFLLTMRGTPYIYNGDEICMANIRFTDIGQYRDLMTINYYHRLQREGGDLREFLAGQLAEISRDNGRTPMQWTPDSNAGFTTGTPWIGVNPDHRTVNVAGGGGGHRLGAALRPPAAPAPEGRPPAGLRQVPPAGPGKPPGLCLHSQPGGAHTDGGAELQSSGRTDGPAAGVYVGQDPHQQSGRHTAPRHATRVGALPGGRAGAHARLDRLSPSRARSSAAMSSFRIPSIA